MTASRSIWKGALTFGLVNIPIALYPAVHENGVDFDWLDRRSLDPVGYKRINKRTGKEIAKEDIVKGIKQSDGTYVVLSDEEIKQAYPKTTQTLEIETFVTRGEIPFVYLDRPYFLEPLPGAHKVYILLQSAMLRSGVVGLARLVLHNKEHLTALIPTDIGLMLDILRWPDELRSPESLDLPGLSQAGGKASEKELTMAIQLIQGMTQAWTPGAFKAEFPHAINRLVERKRKLGQARQVEPLERAVPGAAGGKVIDLTQLLRDSLNRRPSAEAHSPVTARSRRAPARKASSKRAAS